MVAIGRRNYGNDVSIDPPFGKHEQLRLPREMHPTISTTSFLIALCPSD